MKFERKKFDACFYNQYETPQFAMGFTELNFSLDHFSRLYPEYSQVILTQVHSGTILFSSRIPHGEAPEADGIILDERGKIAIIETADCTPLFFWYENSDASVGGVVHVGWRGLYSGIERNLVRMLKEKYPGFDPKELHVFLGPSIEEQCYEVGDDLYEKFSIHPYREEIFIENPPHTGKFRRVLNVKKGITLSLIECGVNPEHITQSDLCTFCRPERFPSYRRQKGTGQRIHNYLVLK